MREVGLEMKELLMEAVRVLRGTLERERNVVSGGGGRGDPRGRDYKAGLLLAAENKLQD